MSGASDDPDADSIVPQRHAALATARSILVLQSRAEEELLAARQTAEQRLVQSEQEYRLLFDGNPHPMFVFDVETLAFLAVNDAAVGLYGFSRDEFLAMTIKEIRPPEEIPALLAYLATIPDTPGLLATQVRHRKKDGTHFEVAGASNPIVFRGRRARVVLVNDLTAHHRSEAKFRGLLEAAPDAMVIVGQDGRIVLVNTRAEALFGYSREELIGRPVKDLVPGGVRAQDPAHRGTDSCDPRPPPMDGNLDLTGRRRDGSEFPVETSLSPVETEDGVLMIAAVRDVSEKKRLEAQLLQAQKMEAVGRLAGGIAHDFNNLLGVITGYSELLLRDLGTHPGVKRLEQIQSAAIRAAGLTRQLLAFSRKQVLQPQVLDLNEVVAEVGKMLLRLIGEDVHLVTEPGAGLGRIRADPGQIQQVLMNLAVNARDAMPKGGGLIIATANVTLDEAETGAYLRVRPGAFVMLSVADTGEGMDAQTKAHLFEPFFTTKEEGKGTGLGLATVFGIVQQSGGSISVDSQTGRGTTFKLYFPRVKEALSHPSPPTPSASPPRGTETILLVEDADSLREMIGEILEGAGYTVIESSGPEAALLKVRAGEDTARLMLTDVVMPRMSGPDLAKSVRAARPGIKVLFMSGYTDEAMGLHGVIAAGTQFIQKPFEPDELLRKVREALDEP